jgi:hypothetical protein
VRLAEAELGEKAGHALDAHLVGQTVIVGVAGNGDGTFQVHHAVAVLLPVPVTVAAAGQGEITRVGDGVARFAHPQFQAGQAHERLDGGARWIDAAQRAVDEGAVEGVVELAPGGGVDAIDKQVGIEAGLGNQRQYAAIARVQGHQGAPVVAEHLFRHLLELRVQMQVDVVAGHRSAARQQTHGPAAGIGLHLLDAGAPMQPGFIARLDAQLADVVGALVVGVQAGFGQAFLVFLADPADIADHVGKAGAEGILAELARVHFHARETVAVHREAGRFFLGEQVADGDALEVLALGQQFLKRLRSPGVMATISVSRLMVSYRLPALEGVISRVWAEKLWARTMFSRS